MKDDVGKGGNLNKIESNTNENGVLLIPNSEDNGFSFDNITNISFDITMISISSGFSQVKYDISFDINNEIDNE